VSRCSRIPVRRTGAAARWFAKHPFLSAETVTVQYRQRKKNGKRGRPGKENAVYVVYFLDAA